MNLRLQCKCIDPDNQGDAPVACEKPGYKGDGRCDDVNNNEACAYDGGDCCPKSVKGGTIKTKYCEEVGVARLLILALKKQLLVMKLVPMPCMKHFGNRH